MNSAKFLDLFNNVEEYKQVNNKKPFESISLYKKFYRI